MLKIIHYRWKCIGCGYCVEVAPAYYRMDLNDGKVDLLDAETTNEYHYLLLPNTERKLFEQAKNVCPTAVIKIEKTK